MYRRALRRIADVLTIEPKPRRLGELQARSLTPQAVDRLYERLGLGGQGPRRRQANKEMDVLRRCWEVMHRRYPELLPSTNPVVGRERRKTGGIITPASRAEAYALSAALESAGHPHLACAPLICFEWHQRPEHVLGGVMTWGDIRPIERPDAVRVRHPKTGAVVWLPLEDGHGGLFPELETLLSRLPRLALSVVATPGHRGPSRPYSLSYAAHLIANVRRKAWLADHVTLAGCRHGGMTELGDAEITEQGVMALSGHKTPQSSRLYVKKTEQQRLSAARHRRA
jgi:hypothetical protein